MTWLLEERSRLDGFRAGDRQTLDQIYRHYAAEIAGKLAGGFNLVTQGSSRNFRAVRSPYELADLVQETFIRAFGESARASYDGVRPFGTFLLAIGRNLVIDHLRRSGRETDLFVGIDDSGPDETGPASRTHSPEEQAWVGQLRRIYDDLVDNLGPDELAVFRYRFVEGLSRAAVTERTGLSAIQIRARETKLRQHLIERLAVGDDDSGLVSLLLLLLMVA